MKYKENTWYNFGDVNHQECGGMFVRKWNNEIEVVRTINNEEYGGKGYTLSTRVDEAVELENEIKDFKNSISDPGVSSNGIAKFADWKQLIDNKVEGLQLLFLVAISYMDYYGGSHEDLTDTNYWKLLQGEGISPSNIY